MAVSCAAIWLTGAAIADAPRKLAASVRPAMRFKFFMIGSLQVLSKALLFFSAFIVAEKA
jgi:hypothetical protein